MTDTRQERLGQSDHKMEDAAQSAEQRGGKSQGDGFSGLGTIQAPKGLASSKQPKTDDLEEANTGSMCSEATESSPPPSCETSDSKKRVRSPSATSERSTSNDKMPKQGANKAVKNCNTKDVASRIKCGGKDGPEQAESIANTRTSGAAEKEQTKGHDKYCHFCQHVKINMLACTTVGCNHRYCIYCLGVHLGDDTEPATSKAWTDGAWKCPTCRSVCCCSTPECARSHRHCKAFRYRLRRADAANMRATAAHALVSLAALGDESAKAAAPAAASTGKATNAATFTGKANKASKGSKAEKKPSARKQPAVSAESGGVGGSLGAVSSKLATGVLKGGENAVATRGSKLFTDGGDVVPLQPSIAAKALGKVMLPSPLKFEKKGSSNTNMTSVASIFGLGLGSGYAQQGLPERKMSQPQCVSFEEPSAPTPQRTPSGCAADALSLLSQAAAKKEDEDSEKTGPSSPARQRREMGAVANLLNSPRNDGLRGNLQPTRDKQLLGAHQSNASAKEKKTVGGDGVGVPKTCNACVRRVCEENLECEDEMPGLLQSTSGSGTHSASEDGASDESPSADGSLQDPKCPSLLMAVHRRLTGGLLMSEWTPDTDDCINPSPPCFC